MTNLLPGLRELRTPLAAGFIWLATLCVLTAERIPLSAAELPGEISNLWRIGEFLGQGPLLAALAFLAYLMGAVWEGLVTGFRAWRDGTVSDDRRLLSIDNDILLDRVIGERVQRRLQDDPQALSDFTASVLQRLRSSSPGAASLDETTASRFSQDPEFQRTAAPKLLDKNFVRNEVIVDLMRTPTRLLGKEPDLWSLWDRTRAEGEIRVVISIPLTALVSAVAIVWTLWCFALIPLCMLLLWLGIRKGNEADAILIDAARAGRVGLASLERVWPTEADEPTVALEGLKWGNSVYIVKARAFQGTTRYTLSRTREMV